MSGLKNYGKILVVAILAGVGVLVTVWDYKNWRYEETKNFGQGRVDERKPAKELVKLYENQWGRVRIRFPETWKVSTEKLPSRYDESIDTNFRWEREEIITKWEENMQLSVMKTKSTLPEKVVAKIAEIEKKGEMLKETEGLQLETAEEGRILTWWENKANKSGQIIYSAAMVKRGDRIITVTCKTEKENQLEWEKTWLEIFKSLVVF